MSKSVYSETFRSSLLITIKYTQFTPYKKIFIKFLIP